jgi:hypothetical protein
MRKAIKSKQAVLVTKVLGNSAAFAVLAAVVAAPKKW